MPRLLPRLLKALENSDAFGLQTFKGPLLRKPRRRKSLWKSLPKPLDVKESLSGSGRTNSLLLDESNIMTASGIYRQHKMMPPVLQLKKSHSLMKSDRDTLREMTDVEKSWWSSPYLRMLSSPIRRCIATKRHLPTDLLVRLTPVSVPTPRLSSAATTFVPDGLLHPRFAPRLRGVGYYVLCWKDVINTMQERNAQRRTAHNMYVHSLLMEQIGHVLRQRVLQELGVIADRLKCSPRESATNNVLRRLTRSEWIEMRRTGLIPWPGAVSVLVVPPLNRDPQSKQRPPPHFSGLPPEDLSVTPKEKPTLPPLATLHNAAETTYDKPLSFLKDQHLPEAKVPLYNGLTLFPSRSQRAALHKSLCTVLDIERIARSKIGTKSDRKEKTSHAFVLFSNAQTVMRVDTVPLAVALWRVRIWEGSGWEVGPRWQTPK